MMDVSKCTDEVFEAFEKHGYDREWLLNPENEDRIEVVNSFNKLTRSYMDSYYVDDVLLFTVIIDMLGNVVEQVRIIDWTEQRPDRIGRGDGYQHKRDMGVNLDKIDISKELKLLGLEG